MALIFAECLKCGTTLKKTDQMVPPYTVAWCQNCDRFAINGDSVSFGKEIGNDDAIRDALKTRGDAILDHERMAKEREEAMLWGDLSDPRWDVL
jgi:NAD-dependent SIR2 family protein deacetylase